MSARDHQTSESPGNTLKLSNANYGDINSQNDNFDTDRDNYLTRDRQDNTVEGAAPNIQEAASIPAWLVVMLFLLVTTTALSIGISFYLYRWRQLLINDQRLLVPEKWGKYLSSVGSGLEALHMGITTELARNTDQNGRTETKVASMIETYLELNSALDEKDQEIRRLRKGYDAEIFRRFVLRFARVDQAVSEFIEDGDDSESLHFIRRLLEDAFEESGVIRFEPDVGDDYRKLGDSISDNPKIIPTQSEEDDFKVAEVIEAGYRLIAGEEATVIIPSKVKVFQLSSNPGA
ncbi:hypothetical protein FV139_17635 [Parahaliea maris]|uniref:Nucleotide exchange factor GrpE n=1 Tax=Parahaliea maris TaxID=2716870 RepID=A0A5C8ZQM3_9GAMM|nr:hypothetical protein [Parahaliea maris]TXS90796.1 hypothetical protein FV139_17635 [Parahaliea maris]